MRIEKHQTGFIYDFSIMRSENLSDISNIKYTLRVFNLLW